MNKRRQQKTTLTHTKLFTSYEIRINSGIQKLFEKDKKPIPLLHDSLSVLIKFTEISCIMNRIERILFSRQLPLNQRNPKSSFSIALLLEFAHNQCDLTVWKARKQLNSVWNFSWGLAILLEHFPLNSHHKPGRGNILWFRRFKNIPNPISWKHLLFSSNRQYIGLLQGFPFVFYLFAKSQPCEGSCISWPASHYSHFLSYDFGLVVERVYMKKPFHSDQLRGWTKGRFFQRFSVLTVSKGSIWIAMDRKWLVPRGRVGSLEEETTAA